MPSACFTTYGSSMRTGLSPGRVTKTRPFSRLIVSPGIPMIRLMNGIPSAARPDPVGGLKTITSPYWYPSKRTDSLSMRMYSPSTIVGTIELCWTSKGCATKLWMTR